MSTDSEEDAPGLVAQDPDDEGRFNRGLRVVFILLILLSILSGYATRPTIHAPMRHVLGDAKIVEVVRHAPSWKRPMLPWPQRPLLVRHRTAVAPNSGLVSMESVFDADGRYLGSRSMIRPSRHEARSPKEIEHELKQNHEQYKVLENLPEGFSLSGYWTRMDRVVNLQWMTAFDVFPVRFDPDTRKEGPLIPAMVLHIWCTSPANEDPSTQDQKRTCPQARRLVLDFDSNTIIRNDYLL